LSSLESEQMVVIETSSEEVNILTNFNILPQLTYRVPPTTGFFE